MSFSEVKLLQKKYRETWTELCQPGMLFSFLLLATFVPGSEARESTDSPGWPKSNFAYTVSMHEPKSARARACLIIHLITL